MKLDILKEPEFQKPTSFPKFGKLPGKPSKLIRLALADIVAAEKARRRIDMSSWCEINVKTKSKANSKCAVCFGGSVMIGTLGNTKPVKNLFAGKDPNGNGPDQYDDSIGLTPSDFPAEEGALSSLDCFRTGDLQGAFGCLDLEFPPNFSEHIYVTRYQDNKVEWKKQMNALADALEAQGY